MQIESLRPALEELERALMWAAEPTGVNGKHIVPTIQTKGKKFKCLAWFWADQWSTREGKLCHEINFCAEHLDRSAEAIIASAVHEMVHLWCHSLGLKDCSKGGRHNKIFKEYAGLLGLECAKPSDSYGYGYTTPNDDLKERITEEFQPDITKFNLFRVAAGKKSKTISKTQKWSCGCVNVRVANGVELYAKCDDCQNPFIVV